jgi:hypothetical protein
MGASLPRCLAVTWRPVADEWGALGELKACVCWCVVRILQFGKPQKSSLLAEEVYLEPCEAKTEHHFQQTIYPKNTHFGITQWLLHQLNGYPIISRSGHWMPQLVQCLDSGGTGRRATLGCLVMLSQGINPTMTSKFCKSHHFFPDQRWFFMTWKTLKNHLWYHTWFIKRRHVGEIIPKQAGQIWSFPKLWG